MEFIHLFWDLKHKIHFICYKYYLQCTCWNQDRPAVDCFEHENEPYKFKKDRIFFWAAESLFSSQAIGLFFGSLVVMHVESRGTHKTVVWDMYAGS